MSTRGEVTFTLGSQSPARRSRASDVPRLLVMADFSGVGRTSATFSVERVAAADIDAAVARLAPSLPISLSDSAPPSQALSISALDELHPDHLVTVVPELRQPLEWLGQIANPATEGAALAAIEAATGPLQGAADAPPPVKSAESNDQLFGRLLGRSRTESGGDAAKEKVSRLIRSALGGQSTSQASSKVTVARGRIIELLTERCRRVLREPNFRDVERAWRSVQWLLSRIEDHEAEIFLLDLSKSRLAAHVAQFKDRLEQSPLAKVLDADGEAGWDLVVGDYSFGLSTDDVMLLATLGAMATRASTAFFAHGEIELAGCAGRGTVDSPADWRYADDDLAALWSEFRRHPAARSIGLAAPRFLLRQPYGSRTDPVTRFAFEEIAVRPDPESFLWGNPAFACALIAARTGVTEAGGEVADLPMPIYRDGSGDAVQPPVEFLFGEKARVLLGQRGLIPLVGGRNTDRVVVPHLDRIATR